MASPASSADTRQHEPLAPPGFPRRGLERVTTSIDNLIVLSDRAEANGDLTRLSATQADALTRARLRLLHGDETAALAVESVLDLRVTMPVYRLVDAQKTITRLAKRAAKAGLPVPTIEEVSRETRDDASEWVTVRLLGAAPVLNGWTCVATIEPWRDAAGTEHAVIYTATGVDALPDEFAAHPSRCQHCNTNRRRNLTFVLRHEDGREMQVGRACLNEYLGTEALATWFVWCELQETARSYGGLSFDSHAHAQWLADNADAAARRDKTPWKAPDLRTFLIAVAAHVRVHGYARSDRYMGSIGTGRQVLAAMRAAEHEQPTGADIETADGVIAWLDVLVQSDNGRSAYVTRLLDCAAQTQPIEGKGGGVKQPIANTIASAIPAYLREHTTLPVSERLNEILPGVQPGETIEIALTVERSLGFALQCVDERGRCVLLRGYRERHETGAMIRVSGEVESMTIYNGTRQTFINRAQVIAAH